MNLHPYKQIKLLGLNKYFTEISNLYQNKMLPNKVMLSGPKGIGKSTLAYHFVNYALSEGEENAYNLELNEIYLNNRSFKLIQNNSHPNFFLVDLHNEKKNIDISQIRSLIDYNNKSAFNNKPRFVLLDNIDKFNVNSVNALLKILEEPNKGIFFILIHNSYKKIKDTLKSRCIDFKIKLNFQESKKVSTQLLNSNIEEKFNKEFFSYYNTPGFYLKLMSFAKENNIDVKKNDLKNFLILIIEKGLYKKNIYLKNNFSNLVELYFLNLYMNQKSRKKLINLYTNFIHKINDCNKFNLDYEILFLEFKSKVLNE
jgi:DNA polymerase-3 subunit delta'